jgi:hypothetical protein
MDMNTIELLFNYNCLDVITVVVRVHICVSHPVLCTVSYTTHIYEAYHSLFLGLYLLSI